MPVRRLRAMSMEQGRRSKSTLTLVEGGCVMVMMMAVTVVLVVAAAAVVVWWW